MTNVVLFFQSTTSKSWRDKLSGVYRFAQEVGWQVQVVDSHNTPAEIRAMLNLWQPIGCIVDRAMTFAKEPVKLFAGLPTVLLDQNPKTSSGHFSTVTNDSAALGRLAAQELLKSGAKSFTYIPWRQAVFWSDEREQAFAAAIRAAGRSYVKWSGSFGDLNVPCGVFCANDIVAQREMALARRNGLRIPEDLLVVGVDNDELICEHTSPTLTSILPDFERGGYLVASLLKKAMDGEKPAHLAYGPVGLIGRESNRWFEKTDPRVTRALAYIRQHACEPELKTDAVVSEMGCSRRLADLRFGEITGHSIRDEIHRIRMDRAFALLRNPRQAIDPIANLCGYASAPFFKKMFKRTTGLTMREWRKRQLKPAAAMQGLV